MHPNAGPPPNRAAMEIHFTLPRVLLLSSYFLAFLLLGGFDVPVDAPSRVIRSWSLLILCHTAGAFLASVTDWWVGNLERSNYRWFLIVLGSALMAFALLQLHALKTGMNPA
ncbi:MAG: hypothetical protein RLZ97_616 [Verrucomicrobiota bacterium]